MLIEFRVSNYRSFDEEVVFSMAAAPRLKKKENTFQPDLKGDPLPPLLKTAAIYGPNASGKSNFVRALRVVKDLVCYPTLAVVHNGINVQPNRGNPLADSISKFEIHFFYEDIRYALGLWLCADHVEREWLKIFPNGKETLLYSRTYSVATLGDKYEFGDELEGGADLHSLWAKTVSPTTLFLTQAVLNSNASLLQLRTPLDWFRLVLKIMGIDTIDAERKWSTEYLASSSNETIGLKKIASLLSSVDVPVESIKVTQREGLASTKKIDISFVHNFDGRLIEFDYSDASQGTKNLFSIATSWLIGQGSIPSVMVFDEFDSSLHPSIVAKLVAQQCTNPGDAQFIFTTHDTHLMDAKVLRRDQFWLMERDRKGASKLSSIYDYEGREGEDVEKRYYEGRYRALPILHG